MAFFLCLPTGPWGGELAAAKQAVPVVVIDAGHGGRDTGVVSGDGVREKDLCLELALKIQDECRRRGSIRVMLTRSADKGLGALERVSLANAEKAGAFLSIHFNASFSPFAGGPRAFYCKGGEEDTGGGSFRRWESVATAHRLESRRLALGLIESLGGSAENLAEIDAPFLQGLDMPAALVEVAFLSNELELAIVREEEDSICERIVGALEAFFAGREGEE